MMETVGFLNYILIKGFGYALASAIGLFLVYLILHQLFRRSIAVGLTVFFALAFAFLWVPSTLPSQIEYPFGLVTYGPANGPALPLSHVFEFFQKVGNFERVENIARAATDVPAPITRTAPDTVHIELEVKEVIAEMADGVKVNYWTYNGQVPGPMMRVREGDTVVLGITNHPTSIHPHNIDLHAVNGPGGGAAVTGVNPGERKEFTFKASNPGLYVYHCAAENPANHMAHGMYGLILVEPVEGLPTVDKEFYVMQGEFYTASGAGQKGLQVIDASKMLEGNPTYVVFNGKVGGTVGAMEVKTGEKVRLFVGNGGVNLISSFHVIGEIFDTVYPEAQMGNAAANFHNVQTTIVPAGGATIVEFTADVPGTYVLVDHALARVDKGAWGTLKVVGDPRPDLYDGVMSPTAGAHGH